MPGCNALFLRSKRQDILNQNGYNQAKLIKSLTKICILISAVFLSFSTISCKDGPKINITNQQPGQDGFDINAIQDTYPGLASFSNGSEWWPYNVHVRALPTGLM